MTTEEGKPAMSAEPRAVRLYRTMRLIREFEERCLAMSLSGEIVGGIHPYIGQEAVAAGVCAALTEDDVVTSTHRGHGHVLAKGADPKRMLAELCGTTAGLNRGRGGSMHAADVSLGVYGANGIVGAGAPIAAGAAWSFQRRGDGRVAVAFFGDGALSQGVVLEAFNLAALWQLPVVFVCENNGYATSLPLNRALAGDPVERAAGFGLTARAVDGMDADAVADAAAEAVERCRRGGGPAFLECRTYRFNGHHSFEEQVGLNYRDDAEVGEWRARDPLRTQSTRVDGATAGAIDAEISTLIDEAVEFARAGRAPDPAEALHHLYADGTTPRPGVMI
ncbi:thiamine pyrophosphate-dependent dehydrogenase E1 component subunit alpha [Streptomyces sp. ISL-22]|uniref:thiamine pyrophosphate-dependent dehydrogenase E1 component subunit alpha n=1 Tax=unclassified Streptomyces TaxID=2593676 RepID=UPI001BE957E5|nr:MULTISPECIES: thiamine pyrophosphate-dependent dehydrogenase E1 component subunit alpha [unclassified Streptomyces]MBT2418124.1 thiamine pyrophosphate-dependent dehydrogenase E1 component subunit alpha [Streptomyces sp. ISL-24]MBT2432201.1 thiamine pyrophosphate-dependent dehydrogenase E1 component subunit alpha [Streptomyces sp. ISL-22]